MQRETDAGAARDAARARATTFTLRGLTVRFQRDANRKVIGLTVDAGRVRDITFIAR